MDITYAVAEQQETNTFILGTWQVYDRSRDWIVASSKSRKSRNRLVLSIVSNMETGNVAFFHMRQSKIAMKDPNLRCK